MKHSVHSCFNVEQKFLHPSLGKGRGYLKRFAFWAGAGGKLFVGTKENAVGGAGGTEMPCQILNLVDKAYLFKHLRGFRHRNNPSEFALCIENVLFFRGSPC